jgi:hypothetical protein
MGATEIFLFKPLIFTEDLPSHRSSRFHKPHIVGARGRVCKPLSSRTLSEASSSRVNRPSPQEVWAGVPHRASNHSCDFVREGRHRNLIESASRIESRIPDVAVAVDQLEQATTLEVRHIGRKRAGLRSFVKDPSPVVGYDPGRPLTKKHRRQARAPDTAGPSIYLAVVAYSAASIAASPWSISSTLL